MSEYETTRHVEECWECGGAGKVERQDPGPYSPDAIEPRWIEEQCHVCRGVGVLDVDRCARCGLATDLGPLGDRNGREDWDYCNCSEDVLIMWERGPQTPEVGEAAENVVYVAGHDCFTHQEYVRKVFQIAKHLSDTSHRLDDAPSYLAHILNEEARFHDYDVDGNHLSEFEATLL